MVDTPRRRPGRPPLNRGWVTLPAVRVPPELRAAAEQRAEQDGITVSDVVRDALAKALDYNPKEN